MKLRNKKTGEIREDSDLGKMLIRYAMPSYDSIEELCEEREDYTTTEPLIKDEKIRKVVRAWAELNDFSKVKLLVSPEYGSQFEGGYGFGRITFTGRTLDLDYPKEYTIAELCGEEGE